VKYAPFCRERSMYLLTKLRAYTSLGGTWSNFYKN
jgi:hypothetical protein